MKKGSILFFTLLFLSSISFAQDGKKAFKAASRALSSFSVGGGTDEVKLQEAIDGIEIAVKDAEFSALSKTWSTRGKIYNSVVNLATTKNFLLQEGDTPVEMLDKAAPIKSYQSYIKALELAEKGWEKKDALKGLSEGISNLNNTGFSAYETQDYATAYDNFSKVISIHNLLKENGEASSLDDPSSYNDQVYTAGLAALNANNMDAAGALFMELEQADFDQAAIYDALYKINKEKDSEKALDYLNKGRERYPDDVSLLFTEINHYLTAGQLDILEDRLKKAIEKEPSNPSLYYTLGRVYVDVSEQKKTAGDEAGEKEYFNKAIEQFNSALEQKEDFYEAMYGIGEMYYNKAAIISTKMQDLTMSKDDQKLYVELEKEMTDIFDKALPYFIATEKLNPNDNNTLVALSEIYARKNDFDKVKEFKTRLENSRAGGTNESYFKNN